MQMQRALFFDMRLGPEKTVEVTGAKEIVDDAKGRGLVIVPFPQRHPPVFFSSAAASFAASVRSRIF
jgi:hypothetical protein